MNEGDEAREISKTGSESYHIGGVNVAILALHDAGHVANVWS